MRQSLSALSGISVFCVNIPVKVAVRRKGNLSQESLSEDPEKYYQEACGVYVNDGKLTFDAHGNFK